MTTDEVIKFVYGMSRTNYAYNMAAKRANRIGGRKYNGKIVFKTHDVEELKRDIQEVIEYYKSPTALVKHIEDIALMDEAQG
jgi:predicted transcriptional regulator